MSSKWEQLLRQAERDNGLPTGILDYVIAQESGGDPNAVSPKGAGGVMQIMPGTAKMLGLSDADRFDPTKAIPAGARYLGQQFKRFGSLSLALAAYNAGPNRVAKYGTVPPIAETQNYVGNIMHKFNARQPSPLTMPEPVPANTPPVAQAPTQTLPPQNWDPKQLDKPQGQMPARNPMLAAAARELGLSGDMVNLAGSYSGNHMAGPAEYGMAAGQGADKPQLGQQDAFQVMPGLISILLNPNLGGVRSRKRVI